MFNIIYVYYCKHGENKKKEFYENVFYFSRGMFPFKEVLFGD